MPSSHATFEAPAHLRRLSLRAPCPFLCYVSSSFRDPFNPFSRVPIFSSGLVLRTDCPSLRDSLQATSPTPVWPCRVSPWAFASDYPRRVPVPSHFLFGRRCTNRRLQSTYCFFKDEPPVGCDLKTAEAILRPDPFVCAPFRERTDRAVARVRLPSEPGSVSRCKNQSPHTVPVLPKAPKSPSRRHFPPTLRLVSSMPHHLSLHWFRHESLPMRAPTLDRRSANPLKCSALPIERCKPCGSHQPVSPIHGRPATP